MASLPAANVPIGRREDGRVRVRLVACLVTITGTHEVRLNNLSRRGASITGETPLRRGSDVIFRWRDIEAFAQVTWVAGARCGLAFDEPISSEALLLARSLSDNRVSIARAEQQAAARDFVGGKLRLGSSD